jgi:hypothetical protein
VRLTKEDRVRFAAQVEHAPGGCWLWTGARDRGGYGTFKVGGQTLRTHRVAYQIVHSGAPRGPVLHLCGNRLCCKPAHLKVGTLKENVAHMAAHGTLAVGARNGARVHPERLARGQDAGSAKLTEKQVETVRKLWTRGASVTALAEKYRVHKSTISRAVRGVQWAHVPDAQAGPAPERVLAAEPLYGTAHNPVVAMVDAERAERAADEPPSTE